MRDLNPHALVQSKLTFHSVIYADLLLRSCLKQEYSLSWTLSISETHDLSHDCSWITLNDLLSSHDKKARLIPLVHGVINMLHFKQIHYKNNKQQKMQQNNKKCNDKKLWPSNKKFLGRNFPCLLGPWKPTRYFFLSEKNHAWIMGLIIHKLFSQSTSHDCKHHVHESLWSIIQGHDVMYSIVIQCMINL